MDIKKRINKKNVCGWPCLPNWVSKRNMVRVGTKEFMKNHWLVVGGFVKTQGSQSRCSRLSFSPSLTSYSVV